MLPALENPALSAPITDSGDLSSPGQHRDGQEQRDVRQGDDEQDHEQRGEQPRQVRLRQNAEQQARHHHRHDQPRQISLGIGAQQSGPPDGIADGDDRHVDQKSLPAGRRSRGVAEVPHPVRTKHAGRHRCCCRTRACRLRRSRSWVATAERRSLSCLPARAQAGNPERRDWSSRLLKAGRWRGHCSPGAFWQPAVKRGSARNHVPRAAAQLRRDPGGHRLQRTPRSPSGLATQRGLHADPPWPHLRWWEGRSEGVGLSPDPPMGLGSLSVP